MREPQGQKICSNMAKNFSKFRTVQKIINFMEKAWHFCSSELWIHTFLRLCSFLLVDCCLVAGKFFAAKIIFTPVVFAFLVVFFKPLQLDCDLHCADVWPANVYRCLNMMATSLQRCPVIGFYVWYVWYRTPRAAVASGRNTNLATYIPYLQ